MIQLVDVHKSYTKEHETIKGVSFEVHEGQIFGLLGPNGAGKTTLMQMIATLMKPTSGQILIDGLSADKDLLEIHRKIGFLCLIDQCEFLFSLHSEFESDLKYPRDLAFRITLGIVSDLALNGSVRKTVAALVRTCLAEINAACKFSYDNKINISGILKR